MAIQRSRQEALLQLKVEDYRRRYRDYPKAIHLETLASCNAACSFCDYPQLARKGQRMEWSLIEKVVSELQEIPAELPLTVLPFKINEPFLDHRLFDVIRLIEAQLPRAKLKLHTNATALTEDKMNSLAAVRALKSFVISLNHHEPAAYEKLMGLPWERTAERIDTLHSFLQQGQRLSCPVVVARVADGSSDDGAFVDFVRRRWPLMQPLLLNHFQPVGSQPESNGGAPAVGCTRWFELSIAATGEVGLCCLDMQVCEPIGDVRRQHLLEIYNGASYRQLRTAVTTRRNAASPCDSCGYIG